MDILARTQSYGRLIDHSSKGLLICRSWWVKQYTLNFMRTKLKNSDCSLSSFNYIRASGTPRGLCFLRTYTWVCISHSSLKRNTSKAELINRSYFGEVNIHRAPWCWTTGKKRHNLRNWGNTFHIMRALDFYKNNQFA